MHTMLVGTNDIAASIEKAKEVSRTEGGRIVKVKLEGGVTAEVRENSDPTLICRDYEYLVAGGFGKRKHIGPNPNPTITEKMKERLARIEEKKKRREEKRMMKEKNQKGHRFHV